MHETKRAARQSFVAGGARGDALFPRNARRCLEERTKKCKHIYSTTKNCTTNTHEWMEQLHHRTYTYTPNTQSRTHLPFAARDLVANCAVIFDGCIMGKARGWLQKLQRAKTCAGGFGSVSPASCVHAYVSKLHFKNHHLRGGGGGG